MNLIFIRNMFKPEMFFKFFSRSDVMLWNSFEMCSKQMAKPSKIKECKKACITLCLKLITVAIGFCFVLLYLLALPFMFYAEVNLP